MEVGIRKATGEDYSAVCALFDEVDALHRDHLPDIFQRPPGEARERDHYLGLIADENVGFFVASAGGELVGFVHVIVRETPAVPVLVPKRYAVVDGIVVESGSRGRGVGGRLMDRAQEWALARGATALELNVYEFNEAAISFYEELGYRTLSRKMRKELSGDRAAG